MARRGQTSPTKRYLDSLPREEAAEEPVKRSGSWRGMLVLAVVVLIASLVALCAIVFSYFLGQQKYHQLEDHLNLDDAAALEDPLMATVNWNELREVNPDTVAWIYIPHTDINYPVVQGTDNDYYLTHDFEGTEGVFATFGALFMDYRNNSDWSDQAYFLYGHHMNDGSMFADIAAMADQGFFDEARMVYVYSPLGNFELRSYSLVHCDSNDPLVQVVFKDAKDMAAYVQDKMDRSVVAVADVPKASDVRKTFALATCDNYSVGRYVLFCSIERTTVRDLDKKAPSRPATGDAESGISDI